ncbi:MAG: phosphopantothenoylcysteine decarboxylase [Candidatus Brocadiia bacterium]
MISDELSGRHILVTSGPTRADIDAVRYITNRSTGRLGRRISKEALRRGARVTMIAGQGSLTPDPTALPEQERERLRIVPITTVDELLKTLKSELTGDVRFSAVIHAMAVLDYVPERTEQRKVRSGQESWTLKLVKTPKVIQRIKDWAPDTYLIGFKLEVDATRDRLLDSARGLIDRTGADAIVANDLARITEKNHPAIVVDNHGDILARPRTKREIAIALCRITGTNTCGPAR